jgi:hypothetical protein
MLPKRTRPGNETGRAQQRSEPGPGRWGGCPGGPALARCPRVHSGKVHSGKPAAEAEVAVDEEQAAEDEEPAADVAPEPEDEDGEDQGETYADWNVPSWQELIASLNRPDR